MGETPLETVKSALKYRPESPVLVDLDGTLLLRNSTECFLAQAHPGFLAALLLKIIDVLKPWRVLPGGARAELAWRDALRVWLVSAVMPWAWRRWRVQGAREAREALNRPLLDALAERDFHVVTFGFHGIVGPLLDGVVPADRIIAAPFLGPVRFRQSGKALVVSRRLGNATLRDALVITDHADHDADLLEAASGRVVAIWPEHREERAHAQTYLPFEYTSQVKHPKHPHVRQVFFGEDCFALALAVGAGLFASLSASGGAGGAADLFWSAVAAAGAGLLCLAHLVVYEIGYAENDALGRHREKRPTLHAGQDRWPFKTIARTDWMAALALSIPGLAVIAAALGTTRPGDLGLLALVWLAYLAGGRLVFAAFNRTPPLGRVPLFILLQLGKGLAIAGALGLPLAPAGAALLLAQGLARSLPYALYRLSGRRWRTRDQLSRLAFFALAISLGMALLPEAGWLDATLAIALAWCLLKARHEIAELGRPVTGQQDETVKMSPGPIRDR